MPNPVSMHDFVSWSTSDIGGFERSSQVAGPRRIDIASNASGPDVIDRPFHEITVSILRIAVSAFVIPYIGFPENVAFIGRAMKNLGRTLIPIEGAVGHGDEYVIFAILAPRILPTLAKGKALTVVVRVH